MATDRQPLRIGITCYPTQGGSGVVATELGLALADRGHQVHFISYAAPFRLNSAYQSRVFYHEVETPPYPLFKYPPFELALTSKMVEVIDSHDLDILHVHYAIPHAIAAYLAREMVPDHRVRVITTLHGTDITLVGQERAYFKPTQFALRRSHALTAVSEYLRKETVNVFGIDQPIAAIPNFVDPERFKPCEPGTSPCRRLVPEGYQVLMHLSNFRPVKRPLDVIETFARVRRAGIKAVLFLLGEGPELPNCRRLAEKLGVIDDVRFMGGQEAVWEVLPLADIFLLPSEFESFGLAALEALACGVPVVASNAGGIMEVLREGETGFGCDVGDVDTMGERAIELLRDGDRLAAMKRAARADVVERFRIDKIVPRYEDLYWRTLAQPSSRRDAVAAHA